MRDRRVYLPRDRPRRPDRTAMQGLERARRVERTAHSKTWLVEVWEQILMDQDAHTAAGFPFVMCALMDRDGFVWVQIIGEPGPDAAEAYFRDRYGDAVWVEWLAAQRHVELAGPVAGRRVIDAATGKRRRSLAEIPFR